MIIKTYLQQIPLMTLLIGFDILQQTRDSGLSVNYSSKRFPIFSGNGETHTSVSKPAMILVKKIQLIIWAKLAGLDCEVRQK